MSLALLFTPSYFDNLHDYAPRVIDRYKRKHKKKIVAPPIEPVEQVETKPKETIQPKEDSKERLDYIRFLRSEISQLTDRLQLVSGLKEVLADERYKAKMRQIEKVRAALDAEYYANLEAQIEEDFLMLAFLMLDE